MELGIKQLVSVALVVAIGIALFGLTDSISEGVEGGINAAVEKMGISDDNT